MNYDLVIPLASHGSAWGDNNELRYCLRSFETNFPLGNVIIVGKRLPKWMNPDKVKLIDAEDTFAHNKDANIIHKVLLAAQYLKGKLFYWSCDDHLVLRKPVKAELVPLYSNDIANYTSDFFTGTWRIALKNTFDFLQQKGCPTFNFDTHTPQPVDADEFVEIFKGWHSKEHYRFTINTLYHNQAAWKKVRQIGLLKGTIERPFNNEADNRKIMHNKLYMNYRDNSLTPELRQVIIKMFPDKSTFEL